MAGLIAATAVAVLVLAAGCRRDRGGPAADNFSVDAVRTESPDLDVAADQVRGTLRDGYMEWACLLECREPEGCHADLRVTVHYHSSGSDRQIVFSGQVDVPVGAHARLGRVQRPAVQVDGLDRVVVDVVNWRNPGDPPPTPRL